MSAWSGDYHTAARRFTVVPKDIVKLFQNRMSAAEYNLGLERARLASYEHEIAKHRDVYIPASKRRIAELEEAVKGQQEKAAE